MAGALPDWPPDELLLVDDDWPPPLELVGNCDSDPPPLEDGIDEGDDEPPLDGDEGGGGLEDGEPLLLSCSRQPASSPLMARIKTPDS